MPADHLTIMKANIVNYLSLVRNMHTVNTAIDTSLIFSRYHMPPKL